jgi:FtsP/CotA-like multicopper oxidase with cupredoxin domain
VWENADIERGTPQKIAARAAQIDPSMPTIRLSAVPFLTWSKPEITVEVGQKVRLILDNEDPISFHAFMIDTPEGHVHVMMPQGGMWATTLTFDQPGEYRFWCPVSNHAKRGMYGRIIVGGGVPGGSFGVPGKNKQ